MRYVINRTTRVVDSTEYTRGGPRQRQKEAVTLAMRKILFRKSTRYDMRKGERKRYPSSEQPVGPCVVGVRPRFLLSGSQTVLRPWFEMSKN